MNGETIFKALSDIGDDLLVMAETRRFSNPWRKWLTTAACIALILCLGAVVLPYFPIGCGSSEAPSAMPMEEECLPENEEAAPECEEPAPETAEPEREEAPAPAPEDCFWYEGVRYVLEEEPLADPADLGDLLGTVRRWDGVRDLENCSIYAVEDSEDLYVQTEEGYCRAIPQKP